MKRTRIATPVLLLVVTITAAAVVFGQLRPQPISADSSVAIEVAYLGEDNPPRWFYFCRATEGGGLYLDGLKVADVPPSTVCRPVEPLVDGDGRSVEVARPVRGLFELQSGRAVVTLQGDVYRC